MLQRIRAASSGPVEAAAMLRSVLGTAEFAAGPGVFAYDQWAVADDDLTVVRIVARGEHVRLRLPNPSDLVAVVVRDGRLTLRRGGDAVVLERGGCGVVPMFETSDLCWDDVRLELFCLRSDLIVELLPQVAITRRMRAPRLTPRTSELGRFWDLYAQLVSTRVLADAVVNASEIIHGAVLHAFAATTVEAFDLAEEAPDDQRSLLAMIDAVETYLRPRLGEPVRIGDIARSLHVAPRTLQLAYQQTDRGTVTGHLRRLRLEAARDALSGSGSGSGSGTTVTAVARRYGYTNIGRFGAHYRVQFDESPSTTLQRRAPAGQPDPS